MPSIRILLGPVLALIGSSAFAADLPNRKTPPDAPQVIADNAFNWNGAYIGGEVGLGIASDKGYANATSTGAFTGSANAKGVGGLGRSLVGGAFAGYNWQHNALVLGAEGDIEATTLRTRATSFNTVSFGPVSPGVASTSTAIPVQVSLRLRAGVAVDKALFYLTSGVTLAQFKSNYTTLTLLPTGSNSISGQHLGWTVGAGAEYALSQNWVARAEYRYTDFGRTKDFIPGASRDDPNGFWAGNTVHHHFKENTLRFGVAYKFN